jgi:hypothetical protein
MKPRLVIATVILALILALVPAPAYGNLHSVPNQAQAAFPTPCGAAFRIEATTYFDVLFVNEDVTKIVVARWSHAYSTDEPNGMPDLIATGTIKPDGTMTISSFHPLGEADQVGPCALLNLPQA